MFQVWWGQGEVEWCRTVCRSPCTETHPRQCYQGPTQPGQQRSGADWIEDEQTKEQHLGRGEEWEREERERRGKNITELYVANNQHLGIEFGADWNGLDFEKPTCRYLMTTYLNLQQCVSGGSCPRQCWWEPTPPQTESSASLHSQGTRPTWEQCHCCKGGHRQ